MNAILASIAAFALSTSVVFSQYTPEAASCETPAQSKAKVLAQNPRASVHMAYQANEAAVFTNLFNQIEPKTEFIADTVVVWRYPGHNIVLIVGFNNGCLVYVNKTIHIFTWMFMDRKTRGPGA